MNVNVPKGYSSKIKSLTENAPTQNSQNNIADKPLNMPFKIKKTLPIKSNNKTSNTKIQSSSSTSLTNDNAVALCSTVTFLSTTDTTSFINKPITNVDNNSTICDYTSVPSH